MVTPLEMWIAILVLEVVGLPTALLLIRKWDSQARTGGKTKPKRRIGQRKWT